MTQNPLNLRVGMIQYVVAPYRTPLFNELSKKCQLYVMYCSKKAPGRKWSTQVDKGIFDHGFLRSFIIIFFVFNPGLLIFLFKQKYDVYVIMDDECFAFTNFIIAFYSRIRGIPYIVWTGHMDAAENRIPPIEFHKTILHHWPIKYIFLIFVESMNKFLYKHAACYLAYSNLSKEFLTNRGCEAGKIFVGTQAMSPSILPDSTKSSSHLKSKTLKVLYLGYLRPEKGVDVLINATINLPKESVSLYIVGDGPEEGRLKALAKGNSNIIFHHNVNAKDRANWYAGVDVVVLPTYWDPWAHTVTESLYYGTPVVVTNSAAAAEVIVSGKNGFRVDAGNIISLNRILNNLIKNPAKKAKMKEYVRVHKNNRVFDVSADANRFLDAIQKSQQSG